MGQCKCGHTRDEEKNCDGTHKVVKAVREEIAQEIEENLIKETSHMTQDYDDAFNDGLMQASAIAKGQK